MRPASLCLDAKANLGESPIWDEQRQCLYWVDIYGKTINRFDPQTQTNQSYPMPHYMGTVVLRPNGHLLIAAHDGLSFYDTEQQTLDHIMNPEPHLPENRMNDGKCDASGRFWVGTMAMSCDRYTGTFYRLDADLQLQPVVSDVGISNGMAWTADNRTLYYIDSLAMTIRAFDYDLATGAISNERVALTIPADMGAPDGMAIDTQDRLWIAHYGGFAVRCWDVAIAQVVDEIRLPVPNVTACAFGGKDLKTLYITTANQQMSEAELAQYPLSGGIFQAELDVTGTLFNRFAN